MQGIIVPCLRCGAPLCSVEQDIVTWLRGGPQREHLHSMALGGSDTPANCRYSHAECHSIITNGTKATSYGSDAHARKKLRRILGENKPKPKRQILSPGFRKDLTRGVDGRVRKRT